MATTHLPDGVYARFVYGVRPSVRPGEAGNFVPVVTQHGPGDTTYSHEDLDGYGYDRSTALSLAKNNAERMAAQERKRLLEAEERAHQQRRYLPNPGFFIELVQEKEGMDQNTRRQIAKALIAAADKLEDKAEKCHWGGRHVEDAFPREWEFGEDKADYFAKLRGSEPFVFTCFCGKKLKSVLRGNNWRIPAHRMQKAPVSGGSVFASIMLRNEKNEPWIESWQESLQKLASASNVSDEEGRATFRREIMMATNLVNMSTLVQLAQAAGATSLARSASRYEAQRALAAALIAQLKSTAPVSGSRALSGPSTTFAVPHRD